MYVDIYISYFIYSHTLQVQFYIVKKTIIRFPYCRVQPIRRAFRVYALIISFISTNKQITEADWLTFCTSCKFIMHDIMSIVLIAFMNDLRQCYGKNNFCLFEFFIHVMITVMSIIINFIIKTETFLIITLIGN